MTDEPQADLAAFEDNGEDDGENAYFGQRAEWHVARAAIAVDGSSRAIHEKFARLYRSRTKMGLVVLR